MILLLACAPPPVADGLDMALDADQNLVVSSAGRDVLRVSAGRTYGASPPVQWERRPGGAEQTWVVAERDERGLRIDVRVDTEVEAAGANLALHDREGRPWTILAPEAWDARGVSLPAEIDAAGRGFVVTVDDRAAIYPVTVDPFYLAGTLVFDNSWYVYERPDAWALGDVNCDGYDDVTVVDNSILYLYYGGVHAPGATPDGTIVGAPVQFGTAVIPVGDIDGDGCDDLVVPGWYTIEVFHGSADGPVATEVIDPGVGDMTLARVGDVNGDGHVDLVAVNKGRHADAELVLLLGDGGSFSPQAPMEVDAPPDPDTGAFLVHATVDGAGDINHDGYDDVVVSFPDEDNGEIHVFDGRADGIGPTPQRSFRVPGEHSGRLVLGIDDANGDGDPDLAWSAEAPDDNVAIGGVGVAYGDGDGWDTAAWTLLDPDVSITWYTPIDGHRDQDGDGYADLLVSAQNGAETSFGNGAWVWHGGPTGLSLDNVDRTANFDFYYPGVRWAGDVDADGDVDLLVVGYSAYAALVEFGPAGDPDGDGVNDDVDCDSDDPLTYPGAPETCDGRDQDCDGDPDLPVPADAAWWQPDVDGDGFGTGALTQRCEAGPHEIAEGGGVDCDDSAAWVNPAAVERCNAEDDDCDGIVDDGPPSDAGAWLPDTDGDGYGAGTPVVACTAPEGYAGAALGVDCDDAEPAVNPGAAEVSGNDLDENCDGLPLPRASYGLDASPAACGCGTGMPTPVGLLALLALRRRRRTNSTAPGHRGPPGLGWNPWGMACGSPAGIRWGIEVADVRDARVHPRAAGGASAGAMASSWAPPFPPRGVTGRGGRGPPRR